MKTLDISVLLERHAEKVEAKVEGQNEWTEVNLLMHLPTGSYI